jgi:hypothetical protein
MAVGHQHQQQHHQHYRCSWDGRGEMGPQVIHAYHEELLMEVCIVYCFEQVRDQSHFYCLVISDLDPERLEEVCAAYTRSIST